MTGNIPDLNWFYDTEFLDDGERIHLISIAVVPGPAVDQTPFYAINADAPWEDIVRNDWLRANVWPHLPRTREIATNIPGSGLIERIDFSDERVMDRADIGVRLVDYLQRYATRRSRHAMWAYYSAYDHVALAQLFGPMIRLPDVIPMWTHDLMQMWEQHGYHPSLRPAKSDATHDALADAHWNRAFHERMTACEGECGYHTGRRHDLRQRIGGVL